MQASPLPIFRTWRDLPETARGAAIALGNFDGVHRGHVRVLHDLHAARPDLPLAVLTFEPHPREFFRPDDPPFRLTLSTERACILASMGVAWLYELPFDHAFSEMTHEAFVADVLCRGIGAKHLACGWDFAFGHRRGGDTAFLAARAEALGMGLTLVSALTDAQGPISSSRIRRALQDGYPDWAAAELGRPWSIRGAVAHGDKRGRSIGFPTANVPLGRHLEPARGVYAVRVALPDGTTRTGVANIGRRPTVTSDTESRLEVHLFDYEGDLYGAEICVALVAFLRAEKRFESIDALRAQISRDAAEGRRILDERAASSD